LEDEIKKMRKAEVTVVDVLIVGGGPAALGLLCNCLKNERLEKLVKTGNGIAILERGTAFGGGDLQHFLINSNTSSDGFLHCLY